jgi:hypothetical protein
LKSATERRGSLHIIVIRPLLNAGNSSVTPLSANSSNICGVW